MEEDKEDPNVKDKPASAVFSVDPNQVKADLMPGATSSSPSAYGGLGPALPKATGFVPNFLLF